MIDKTKINGLITRILYDDDSCFLESDAMELANMLPSSHEAPIRFDWNLKLKSKEKISGNTNMGQIDIEDNGVLAQTQGSIGCADYLKTGEFEVSKITKGKYINIKRKKQDADLDTYRLFQNQNNSWVLKKGKGISIKFLGFSFKRTIYRRIKSSSLGELTI